MSALPMLVNTLAQCGSEVVLVLDDYHAIVRPEIHEAVRFLLEHLPHSAHIVVASRAEPPVGVARLRAHVRQIDVAALLKTKSRDALQFSITRAAVVF